MGALGADLPGLGSSFGLSIVSLVLVCAAGYVVLRWLARSGVGQCNGPLRVLSRCPIEARKSLYLIEAGERCFLIGVGDGPMTLLAEFAPGTVVCGAPATGEQHLSFGEILDRVLRRKRP